MVVRLILGFLGLLGFGLSPGQAESKPVLQFESAFGGHKFERPLVMLPATDKTGGYYVVEQGGLIWKLKSLEGRERTLVVDLSEEVRRRHGEEGLLSAALDPRFHDNGRLFVYYSASAPRRTVLARVDLGASLPVREPSRVLMTFPQPYGNHNGGTVLFGPDGMLYLGVGDGGSGGDPLGHGQNMGTLLGSVVRLDVRRGVSVPSDNPFVGRSGARPEIWAYGLRNPWRMSFDRVTGKLWVGDVGQSRWEEVNVVERGGNYGWKLKEGNRHFERPVADRGLVDPVHQYGRRQGKSITGGYVYRGRGLAGLSGSYVFGDFATRRIWALAPGHRLGDKQVRLGRAPCSIASFAEDRAAELYVVCLEGRILRLESAFARR